MVSICQEGKEEDDTDDNRVSHGELPESRWMRTV